MKPNVYIDGREHSGTRGEKGVDLITLDVGSPVPMAYITLPFSPDDLTPHVEWCKRELTKLTDPDVFSKAIRAGRVEFEVVDAKSGTLYTVNDVIAELLQAVSSPGGIYENPRDTFSRHERQSMFGDIREKSARKQGRNLVLVSRMVVSVW